MADPDDVTVSYTVKELLRNMQRSQVEGFARIEEGLKSKADKGDIKKLEDRLDRHEGRIGTLEARQSADETAETTRENVSRTKYDRLTRIYLGLGAFAAVAAVVISIVIHG